MIHEVPHDEEDELRHAKVVPPGQIRLELLRDPSKFRFYGPVGAIYDEQTRTAGLYHFDEQRWLTWGPTTLGRFVVEAETLMPLMLAQSQAWGGEPTH